MEPGLPADQDCLSDELLVRLSEGRLPPEEMSRALRHAARCDACHKDIAAVAHVAWEPPSAVDDFRLVRRLGHGGMGVVYLARDTTLEREVAIKFIAEARPEPRTKEYFESEARLLARLHHPNVVTVFRVGQTEGHPYIASEYVVGNTLARLPAPLPWPRVLALSLGLARGLAAAHRQGVLHRDIKPSNAIETIDGGVKLLDFGLAQRAEQAAQVTGPGARTVVGTPPYIAPELYAGSPATPRSDLYALGLVLHELSTGWLPRDAPADSASGSPPSQAPLTSGTDPELAAIIQRCIQPDPEERYASADLLCEALQRLAARVPAALSINPYRGLAHFEPEHQALFFGRDADIQAVLERLHRQPLVLVAADSGTGKSSLCRAGVLPRAATGAVFEGRPATTVTLTPGRRPLHALAAALAPILYIPEAELLAELSKEPERLVERVRVARGPERSLLLFVDQLEELVTLDDPDQAAVMSRVLGELALQTSGVRVLLAVRGDFFTRIAALPVLGAEVERALYLLRPMSPEGLREAVIGPARACEVTFEPELTRQLLESAARDSGGLPLLSFALAELWERRDVAGARVTCAALDELGGVEGLLSRHADGVVARLGPNEQAAARRLLVRLVTLEGTRVERTGDELDLGSGGAGTALQALVDGRLLHARTTRGRVTYQIAHEALIQRWALLRHWLDDDAGQRALRQRLENAASEWSRLNRPRELLWRGRQLGDVRPLDPSTLGPLERVFLSQSRRRLNQQRRFRWVTSIAAAAAVAGTYAGLRLKSSIEDARIVSAHLQAAGQWLEAGSIAVGDACDAGRDALAGFDAPDGGETQWDAADDRWASALGKHRRAASFLRDAEQSLQGALDRESGRSAAHQMLEDVAYRELELEECFHPQGSSAEDVRRLLQRFEDEHWRRRVDASAELQIITEPGGARVEVEQFVDTQGLLRLQARPGLGPAGSTPIDHLSLPAGSYLLRFVKQDRAPVVLPVLLTRGLHERVEVALPKSLPDGYAYVPPGCFLEGSDQPEMIRRSLHSTPLHRACMSTGYLIAKHEVTFGDWLEYLNALPAGARARHLLEQSRPSSIAAIELRWRSSIGWTFAFYRTPANARPSPVPEGEPFRYPPIARRQPEDWRQFPLTGISVPDLEEYLSWLDRSGRLRGARLCGEYEWERAASGADGRAYPAGDHLSAQDANFDATYGRQTGAYGPSAAGSHPGSRSPFGLDDMAGNAVEMTIPYTSDLGGIVLRGAGWYYNAFDALVANRNAGEPNLTDPLVGTRVCASYPPDAPSTSGGPLNKLQ